MSASSRGEVTPWTTTASSSGALGSSRDRLDRLLLELEEARLDLRASISSRDLDRLDARDEERPALEEFERAEADLSLHHEVVRAFARR